MKLFEKNQGEFRHY